MVQPEFLVFILTFPASLKTSFIIVSVFILNIFEYCIANTLFEAFDL